MKLLRHCSSHASTVGGKVVRRGGEVDAQNVRIETLEKFMERMSTDSPENTSSGNAMMENQGAKAEM